MDGSLLQFTSMAFVSLMVVINPVAVAPIFVALTNGMSPKERTTVLNRALVIAFGVATFFLLAGRLMLSYLGVSMYAFAVSGGVLLFLIAQPMLFGQKAPTPATEETKREQSGEDVAIFPLAIPMLAGPGTIATVLVLATHAAGSFERTIALVLTLISIYLISWPILHASDRLIAKIGDAKVGIITRVLGIVLAALAVQYVFNGITGYYESLLHH